MSDKVDTGSYQRLKATLKAVLIGVFQGVVWVSLVLFVLNIALLVTTGDWWIP